VRQFSRQWLPLSAHRKQRRPSGITKVIVSLAGVTAIWSGVFSLKATPPMLGVEWCRRSPVTRCPFGPVNPPERASL